MNALRIVILAILLLTMSLPLVAQEKIISSDGHSEYHDYMNVIPARLMDADVVIPDNPESVGTPGVAVIVKILFWTDSAGTVTRIDSIEADPPITSFSDKATEALRRTKFTPAKRSGRPIETVARIIYSFQPPDACRVAMDHSGEPVFTPYESAPSPIPGKNPQPAYPVALRGTGTTGRVLAKIYVNRKGDVVKAEITKAEPPGKGFEDEVLKVICDYKFSPATQNGDSVGVWVVISFNFRDFSKP